MSVVNGQVANQTTFNQAFMSRTAAATSTVAKTDINNATDATAPTDGALHTQGGLGVEKKLFVGGKSTLIDLLVKGKLTSEVETNTQEGSDVVLTNPTKYVVVITDADLLSIGSIVAPTDASQVFILLNRTGHAVDIKDTDTGVNSIRTGRNATLSLPDGKSLFFVYDPTVAGRWRLAGGTGSGSIPEIIGDEGSPKIIDPTVGFSVAAGNMSITADEQIIFAIGLDAFGEEISANPQIQAGTIVGQKLHIYCISADNFITTHDGDGLEQNGNYAMTLGSVASYFWTGSKWNLFNRNT